VVAFGRDAHGSWADIQLVDQSMCLPLPEPLSYAVGAAAACSIGTAFHALQRAALADGDELLVYNIGSLGMSATALGKAFGARIIAVEPNQVRQQIALDLGASDVLTEHREDVVEVVRAWSEADGPRIAFDPTGSDESHARCVEALRPWGQYCVTGEGPRGTSFPTDRVIAKQIAIQGIWSAGKREVRQAASMCADRGVPIGRMITHELPLDQALHAFELYESLTTGKVMITP
jgi:threonine dehydrogenase-like Zn-dependent dehydrogenase